MNQTQYALKTVAKTTVKAYTAFGKIEGRLMITVYTVRGEKIRIISMRKANARERRLYEQYIQNRLEKG